MTIDSDVYTGEEYLYDELGVRKSEVDWLKENKDLPIVKELFNEIRMYDIFHDGMKVENSYCKISLFRIECRKQLLALKTRQE